MEALRYNNKIVSFHLSTAEESDQSNVILTTNHACKGSTIIDMSLSISSDEFTKSSLNTMESSLSTMETSIGDVEATPTDSMHSRDHKLCNETVNESGVTTKNIYESIQHVNFDNHTVVVI